LSLQLKRKSKEAALTRTQLVSEPPHPDAHTLPRDGDVVVLFESRSAVKYTVRQLPGVAQFHTSGWDEAVHLARNFAKRAGVDLWYCEDGTYRLDACRREGV